MNVTYLDYVSPEIIAKNSKTVKSYVSKKANQNPDTKLCPEITIYWKQTYNGKAFHLLKGEHDIIPANHFGVVDSLTRYSYTILGQRPFYECSARIITAPKKETEVFYVKYEPILEMLELSVLTIDSRKIPEEKREYRFAKRYFLFKNCPAPFDSNGNLAFQKEAGKYYNVGFINYFKDKKAEVHGLMSSQFKAFTGINSNPKFPYMKRWDFYAFLDHYKSMYPRAVSKTSANVADISNALPEHKFNLNDYPVLPINVQMRWGNTRTEYKNSIWMFSIINNNTCVFRHFKISDGEEKIRVIVDGKGKVSILKPFVLVDGTTLFRIVSETPYDIQVLDSCCYFIGFEDLYKFKRLRYISEMVNDKEALTHYQESQVSRIVTFLRFPYLERFYKAGYKHICNFLLPCASKKSVEDLFGVKLSSSANVYKISGLNKYQLHKLDDFIKERQNDSARGSLGLRILDLQRVINFLAFMVGKGNISDLSNKDTDWYFSQIFRFPHSNFLSVLYKTYEIEGTPYITTASPALHNGYNQYRNGDRFAEEDVKKVLKVMHLQKKTDNKNIDIDIYRLFSDCVSLFSSLSIANRPNIDLYDCDSCDELYHIHNMLIEIDRYDRTQREKEANEKIMKHMGKLKKEREEKFSWTDGEYSIIIPETPTEIVEEGHYLHHCVGGYVNRVAEGTTNILFLRKNRYLNIPFYTIEVNNNNAVEQIHGMCNCWLGTAPEAVKSVINWIREKGIKCSTKMVLNKGTGYSPSTENLNATEYGLGGKAYV